MLYLPRKVAVQINQILRKCLKVTLENQYYAYIKNPNKLLFY